MAKAIFLEAAPFLLVDDVVKSGEYYRDVLGFNLGRYFGDPPGFVIMQRNTARVMLRQAPASARPAAVTDRIRGGAGTTAPQLQVAVRGIASTPDILPDMDADFTRST